MSGLEHTVVTFIGLLAVTLIVSILAERIGVPYVVALLLVATPISVPASADFAPAVLFVFLPALIFEAAWNVDRGVLRSLSVCPRRFRFARASLTPCSAWFS